MEFTYGVSSLKFFTRLPDNSVQAISDDGRTAVRLISPPLGPNFLLAAAHLRSKLHADPIDQHLVATALHSAILEAEERVGHKRTLVMGDLNMDPFEPGMSGANGLHAVMDKATALKIGRTVLGKGYEFFYNPMWSRMGDESPGPPGTYYYNRSGSVINQYWSTFDQILLRPDLLMYYDSQYLIVVENTGNISLIKDSVINRNISDHLPLILNLRTELGEM